MKMRRIHFSAKNSRRDGDRAVADLLARAAAFQTLALAFGYPDDPQLEILARRWRGLTVPPTGGSGRALLNARRRWRAYEHDRAGRHTLREGYHRLFLGQAPVSLNETAYGDGAGASGRTHELADIAGFYLAFGWQMGEHAPDLPDHLAAELEFVATLLIRLAHARHQGWSPGLRTWREALRAFLGDHLGRWTPHLPVTLAAEAAASPYRTLAEACAVLVADESRRQRIRPRRCRGRTADAMQTETLTCPRAAANAQPN